jgi:hypothetical protein
MSVATYTEKQQREVRMYGCTEEELRESVESSLSFKFSGPAMVAMSMMSDAQEEMANGMTEYARRTINCAKWILVTYVMSENV